MSTELERGQAFLAVQAGDSPRYVDGFFAANSATIRAVEEPDLTWRIRKGDLVLTEPDPDDDRVSLIVFSGDRDAFERAGYRMAGDVPSRRKAVADA